MVSPVSPIQVSNERHGGNDPDRPAPHQRSVRCEKAAFDAAGAQPQAGKEIERIMQRAAELEREGSLLEPSRGREGEGQWHIGERRSEDKTGKISGRMCLGG